MTTPDWAKDIQPITELTIDRAEWGRGRTGGYLCAIGKNPRLCCLGLMCRAMGVPEAALVNQGTPRSLGVPLPHLTKRSTENKGRFIDELFASRCARANDRTDSIGESPSEFEAVREKEIAELFASEGITVTYVGELVTQGPDCPL